ncbi:gastrin-releasing peptide [Gadus morhua]|uniref:Gastrin-releasing peptide n=1 Tax=Gadus morhua TaxID=8049 RepID=A0A8C5F4D5_GADMO|nr:gastrin-releasing peptide [Gadus morhua]
MHCGTFFIFFYYKMGDECVSFSWTYRQLLPMLLILGTFSCMGQCSQSPPALLSKSYPRGNHWAVGHLMGRKSVEMLPEPPVYEQDGDDPLTSLERRETPLEQPQYPSKLDRDVFGSSPANRRLQGPHGADRRHLERTRSREEVRVKPLREMPDLLLLGLHLKNGGST